MFIASQICTANTHVNCGHGNGVGELLVTLLGSSIEQEELIEQSNQVSHRVKWT